MAVPRGAATALLARMRKGDRHAGVELYQLLYEELRRLAASQVRRQASGGTLQATALVHEAWVRLANTQSQGWRDREHFFAVAARAMRFILVDAARRRSAWKRGGGRSETEALEEVVASYEERHIDLLALEEALTLLVRRDERQARIVELRFHGGLSMGDAARVLGVSKATAERDWAQAREFLRARLGVDPAED